MRSGGSRICKRAAKVVRRRREDRGAVGARYPAAEGAEGFGRGGVNFDFGSQNVDF